MADLSLVRPHATPLFLAEHIRVNSWSYHRRGGGVLVWRSRGKRFLAHIFLGRCHWWHLLYHWFRRPALYRPRVAAGPLFGIFMSGPAGALLGCAIGVVRSIRIVRARGAPKA